MGKSAAIVQHIQLVACSITCYYNNPFKPRPKLLPGVHLEAAAQSHDTCY